MAKSRTHVPADKAETPFFFGVDVGGTNIKLGLVDNRGQTIAHDSISTHVEAGPMDAIGRIADALVHMADRHGVAYDAVPAIGLATPGTMDIPAGMLIRPHNLPGWYNFPIRDRLAEACKKPVAYANDAGAAAYGEYWVGSGQAFHSILLLTLGTGIGGGIIVGHLSIDGENSHGSECGHIIIDYNENARMCGCGKTGHLEAYASAVAVIKRTEEALTAGRPSSLKQRRDAGEEITPLMLSQEAEKGDELSLELIVETARYVGIGAASLIYVIDPGAVILGGAMTFGGHDTELGRRFLDRVHQEIRDRAFPVPAEKVTVDLAALGGEAGYIGAAGIARLAHQKNSG